MTGTITPSDLEDRFEEAARTLARLPDPPGSTPRGYSSAWPEYAHDPGQSYGYNKTRLRVVPSPAAIKQMEECLEWLSWLGPDDARIVWLRAEGKRWRQIAIRTGCVRQTAWRRWAAALVTIAKRLNHNAKRKPAPTPKKIVAEERVAEAARDDAKTLL
ncbi:MAG TPA: DUF6362 family protein [Amaricoccus sp.]|uniref:DUF6362 family protein n=1 Tax=Amaricoccus sp. TaxID=1872485 RepID=UPI002B8945BD|nr:DUF6362 family protein [Amaricoccus sp.]HMQ94630.1 DUF6362 family protein [Amaricoccus sp.]HMR54751.1 DUF6362 family protein [Amaricoccus sp.]HMR61686.1 DUF6362 family protein [Amaricoccus sp.]HMU01763.1 DUF6362 family protein [Amaricoccus sp.]